MFLKKLNIVLASIVTIMLAYTIIPINYVAKELKPYYNDYMFLVQTSCRADQYWYPNKVYITFGKLSDHVGGECKYRYPYEFQIAVNKKIFNWLSEDERFQLLAHEMRHCLFRVDHSSDPSNYMYYDMPTIPKYVLYKQIETDLTNSCK